MDNVGIEKWLNILNGVQWWILEQESSESIWILSPTQDVSDGNHIRNENRDYSCVILAKNVAAFCSCPKNLLETKL